MGDLVFVSIAVLVIVSALGVVVSPNLVYSALSLLFALFGIAGLYIFLYADFLAATQVVIYVGGILVLIIFGVMLTNKIENVSITNPGRNKIAGATLSLILLFVQFNVIFNTKWNVSDELIEKEETVSSIGRLLLTDYILPFEVASVILLAALIGAAMLSRKKVEN